MHTEKAFGSSILLPVILSISGFFLNACNSATPEKTVVEPEKMDVVVGRELKKLVSFTLANKSRINDTIRLADDSLAARLYAQYKYEPLWCTDETWLNTANNLFSFISNCKYYGLFPGDYHFKDIRGLRAYLQDSIHSSDPLSWSRADLLMTDAFLSLCHDLKRGRLDFDSVTLRTDSVLPESIYLEAMRKLRISGDVKTVFKDLEPKNRGYDSLKTGLKEFLDSVQTFKRYTYLRYQGKNDSDFYRQLQHRLFEEDFVVSPSENFDSATWKTVITNYQKKNNLKVTGRANEEVVNALNKTDWEKFIQIAINLDRYKLLPDSLPEKYLWANIPSFYLDLRDRDTLVFRSRIVVGKSTTPTPLLSSSISNMITYPQWNIPTSIVVKEIIPGMRKDTNYLTKKGYVLINNEGQEINPQSLNWWKYNKGIPYRVIQGSGDDNALGILKFNFNNKYSVYLHDTNQRYLFSRSNRSLSHGCVRVQEWKKLAWYLLRQDSLSAMESGSLKYSVMDSVKAWLDRKEKHWIPVKNRMPLFIRYQTSEFRDGRLRFYDDIYGLDKILRQRYFDDKPVQ